MNLNKTMIVGRITKQLEPRTTPTGFIVLDFSVATNYRWKDKNGQKQEEVEFHNVVCFGKTAEIIAKYFNKGDEIYLEGRLKTNSWVGQDGIKRYKTQMIIEKFDFGQKVNPQRTAQPAQNYQPAQPARPAQSAPANAKSDDEYFNAPIVQENYPQEGDDIRVESIPF